MPKPSSDGICSLCGKLADKRAMARHLSTCLAAHEAGTGRSTSLVLLHVDSDGPWWLNVEARAEATLADLDDFLRYTWLECCGHMSAFFRDRSRDEYDMDATLAEVFSGQTKSVRYEYDFGSTTELRLSAAGLRSGKASKSPVRIGARNQPPEWTCGECDAPATQVCPFSYDEEAFVCDAHAADHACDDSDCHLPVVDSPRMGVCGYTGR